jgi:hypothetical protein
MSDVIRHIGDPPEIACTTREQFISRLSAQPPQS